jgi:hypothetical protein
MDESITDQLFREVNQRFKVNACATATKTKKGKDTGEQAIVFFVDKKLPKNKLDPSQAIPEEIAGYKTDVIQSKMRALSTLAPPRLLSPEMGIKAGWLPGGDRKQNYRPAPAGISCGHPQVTAGTIGGWFFDRNTGDKLLLSNNHVIAATNKGKIGDPIYQPGVYDGGDPADTLANLLRFQKIGFDILSVNAVDAAVAKPLTEDDVDMQIADLTARVYYWARPSKGMACTKSGRTTGVTSGVVSATDWAGYIDYGDGKEAYFVMQTYVNTYDFIAGGDSGSLLLMKPETGQPRSAIGLCFAGDLEGRALANYIRYVMTYTATVPDLILIQGYVTSAGSAVPGAKLLFYNNSLDQYIGSAETDGNGFFEFKNAAMREETFFIFAHASVGNQYRSGWTYGKVITNTNELLITVPIELYDALPAGLDCPFRFYGGNWLYGDIPLEQYFSVRY